MPKMKTNKTAAKRFKVSGTGKLRRQKANRQHLFEKKSSVRTRRLAGTTDVHPGDTKNIKRLLEGKESRLGSKKDKPGAEAGAPSGKAHK